MKVGAFAERDIVPGMGCGADMFCCQAHLVLYDNGREWAMQ